MKFSPCTGKCTEDGEICEGCGRTHEEIAEMKTLVAGLVSFAKKMEYENIEDFANGVSGSIKYQMESQHTNNNLGIQISSNLLTPSK